MMTDDEFSEALRNTVAELSARYYRVDLPEAGVSTELRMMTAVAVGLLDILPGEAGPNLLRHLGEAACDGG